MSHFGIVFGPGKGIGPSYLAAFIFLAAIFMAGWFYRDKMNKGNLPWNW